MPLTQATIRRAQDASGDLIRVFDDGSGALVQGTVLVGADGLPLGGDSSPLVVRRKALTRVATGGQLANTLSALNVAGVVHVARALADPAVLQNIQALGVWLMLFDSATAPTAGDTPIARAAIDGTQVPEGRIEIPGGIAVANGAQLAFSTTLDVYTPPASPVGVLEAYVEP